MNRFNEINVSSTETVSQLEKWVMVGPGEAKNNKCDSGASEHNDFADSENCDN